MPNFWKIKSATAFKTKTIPNATEVCLLLAFKIGATAAMALPPQIAVPAEMS